MSEEIEKESQPGKTEEEIPAQTPEEEAGPEKKEETEKPKAAKKRKWLPAVSLRLPKLNKRLVRMLAIASMVLVLLGGAWYTKDHWLEWGKKIDFTRQPKRKLNQDRSIEEKLDPFFIPISIQGQESIALIDFSVIWDGLTSVRYKKMELEIRDDIYEQIKSLAQKDEHFKDQAAFLEEDMGRIFRRTLGVEDLKVKIKEIKVY
jgi:hypothetical protein